MKNMEKLETHTVEHGIWVSFNEKHWQSETHSVKHGFTIALKNMENEKYRI
jgi:hypothetical protein